MPTIVRGNPTIRNQPATGVSIVIDSAWSSAFQQFLTARRIPSFLEVAGVRVGDRLCDELSLGQSVDVARVEAALVDWEAASPAKP
jgi:hypothetical protein